MPGRISRQPSSALLDALQTQVPKVLDEHGMEAIERHALPYELETNKWRGAALILQLGELAAEVEGDPLDDVHI